MSSKSNLFLIAKNSLYGFGGSFATLFFRFIISIAIVRTIGSESFGIYVLALATISIGDILALVGLENTLVKFVAQYKTAKDVPRLKGTIIWSTLLVIVMSTVTWVGLFLLAPFLAINIFHKPELSPILRILCLSIPLISLRHIFSACLRGLKLVKYSVLLQQILSHGFRFICVISALISGSLLAGVTWAVVVAEILTFICSAWFLIKNVPEILQKSPAVYEIKKITFYSINLLFSGFSNRILAQADILILGYFMSGSNVGLYGVIKRFAPLITMPLNAFNNIFAPIISDLYEQNMKKELEFQFKTVARWVFMISLPVYTILIYFSKPILNIFDPVFVTGSLAMIIYCTGQMTNSASGSVGFMLMMTGRPHMNLMNSVLLCSINITLNIILIPLYGIVGCACSGAFSIAAIQLLRLAEVWCFFRIHPYRPDFLKPVVSCLASVTILYGIGTIRIDTQSIVMLILLSVIFFLSYGSLLWLLRLSPEDYLFWNQLSNRLSLNRK